MSATATCYTCVSGGPMENLKVHLDGSRKSISVNVQLNDGQIPKWYQMAGNYSPLAPVFTTSGQISPGPPGPAEITGVNMTIFAILGRFF